MSLCHVYCVEIQINSHQYSINSFHRLNPPAIPQIARLNEAGNEWKQLLPPSGIVVAPIQPRKLSKAFPRKLVLERPRGPIDLILKTDDVTGARPAVKIGPTLLASEYKTHDRHNVRDITHEKRREPSPPHHRLTDVADINEKEKRTPRVRVNLSSPARRTVFDVSDITGQGPAIAKFQTRNHNFDVSDINTKSRSLRRRALEKAMNDGSDKLNIN